MSAAQAYPQLVDALQEVRRQWRQQKLLEGCLLSAGATLGVLVVLVAADNLLAFGTAGRVFTAMLLWGGAGAAVLTWVVRRLLEDQRDDFFAAMVEQQHPELRNRLINGLQLGRGNELGSRRLIDQIVNDAAAATADMELADCVDYAPARRAAAWAGGVCLVIAAYVLLTPRFSNGFSRILLPVAAIEPYTATRIDEESINPRAPNNRFPEGSSIPIAVTVSGAIPRTAQLYRQGADGRWQPSQMQADEAAPGTFRGVVSQPLGPFDFYIVAGDDRSAPYHVDVVKRPQVEAISLTYALPDYTERPPQVVEKTDGEIGAICGTVVTARFKATKPLSEASLVFDSDVTIALEQGADPMTWQTTFLLWQRGVQQPEEAVEQIITGPARYQVRLQDTDGYDNGDSLWHNIALLKDLPPAVAITVPGRDQQVKPDDTLELKLTTRDDYGVGPVRVLYRVNDEEPPRTLAAFPHDGEPQTEQADAHAWPLTGLKLKSGDIVKYWATAQDRNNVTGPGKADSRYFSLFVIVPEQAIANLEVQLQDFAAILEDLVRLQRQNRAETASRVAAVNLVARQTRIRTKTAELSQAMRRDGTPVLSMIDALDELHLGLMAQAVKLLEAVRDAADTGRSAQVRQESLPVQDEIIARLQALLARLQRNEQARDELKRLAKTDKAAHKAITQTLSNLVKDLDRLAIEETELKDKFEKMPKRAVDELKDESDKALMSELDALEEKWSKWQKGAIDDLTKLPTGFVDDFSLKEDVNRVFEEVEQAAQRSKATSLEVALEDLGAGLATEMLEDLELWMPDSPDSLKWVQEEPLGNKPMAIPEMPLPDALEDLVGELMQEAEEFDEEADDITSAWGDNLNQAGWGVSDGPISSFSAKGKTGNDLPNTHEVTGRSGDGRRGKSAGQMVGDTARGLPGRKTPARVGNERYEPGQLKEEGRQDPSGATGGGKKAGTGKKGLQGGTPPDYVKDMERLSAKQASVREKADKVAERLDTAGINSSRLKDSIQLMRSAQQDLRDLKYEDATRKQKVALGKMKSALGQLDQSTAINLQRARQLPSEMRQELLQSNEEGYPAGYETLLKSYFRALSEAEK